MTDLVNVTAAIHEAELIGENNFTFEFANQAENGKNFALQLWTFLAQNLRLRLQIVVKTKDVSAAVAAGKAAVGLSLVPLEPLEKGAPITLLGPLLEKSLQLVVARDEGPLLADLRAVFGPAAWALVGLAALLFWLALMALVARPDPAEIALTVAGMVAYQGALAMDSSRGGRVVLLVGLLFGLLVFNAFSAGLVSQLAVGRPAAPPAAAQVLAASDLLLLLPAEQADLADRVGQVAGKGVRVEVTQDWARVCLPGSNALLLPSPAATLTTLPCETDALPERFFARWWGLVVRKGPLADKIRKSIQVARSSGLLDKWRRAAQGSQGGRERLAKRTGSTRPAGLAFIAPMVAVLAVGLVAAFLVLLLEILVAAAKSRFKGKGVKKERKKDKGREGKSGQMPYLIIVKQNK